MSHRPWTKEEELYRTVSQRGLSIIPFPHFLASVWDGMKRLYPDMTPEFWATQERRVGIHWNMGLTVDRSIDELRPFADAQIAKRKIDLVKSLGSCRWLCEKLLKERGNV